MFWVIWCSLSLKYTPDFRNQKRAKIRNKKEGKVQFSRSHTCVFLRSTQEACLKYRFPGPMPQFWFIRFGVGARKMTPFYHELWSDSSAGFSPSYVGKHWNKTVCVYKYFVEMWKVMGLTPRGHYWWGILFLLVMEHIISELPQASWNQKKKKRKKTACHYLV